MMLFVDGVAGMTRRRPTERKSRSVDSGLAGLDGGVARAGWVVGGRVRSEGSC